MKTLPDWLTVSDTPDWDHLWAMPRDWPAMYAHTESDDPFWREHRQEISAALVSFGQRIVPRMLADLEAVEWEALSPGDLVVLWQQGMIARTALYDLSDAEDKDQDETIRRLYGMLVKEGVWLCAQHHATSPLAFAASVAAGHFPQGPLLAEISRRGEQHPPGFAAAIVRLCHALRARTGLSDLPSEISALAELEGRAKGHLQRRNKAAWARLREPIPMLEVAGQIPITVDKYWGGSDPLRVLAAALSGDLNVAPLKIASAVQGQARHQRRDIERQRQHDDPKDLEFTIVEARSRTGTARWNGLAALLLRDGQPPLSKDECRDLLRRFLAAHPEHAQGMECALAENVTDDELAARYSCNRKTIHNRRQRAKLSLRSFYHSHA